ncbi:type 1 pili usher pathway chaperone CsuC [Alcanivorax nanhaiticus]|uniref:Type 1 pili usher pathway chaperone CsuC n=1 Tax=Alcanivorax nanhaiticus TaxID=1177154 RepID=A0A095US31_9GAMM|nr:fimbria/pilus periplasmic chaperone [Alcanivorax nanhaiticus]KGD65345.1 type 1 pili usher pathway chaperone CsuC [Alcanivorax nanhaiticus]
MLNRLKNIVFCALLAGPGSMLYAGQLTVAPLTLTMAPTQPNATYKLTNGSDKESFYQLQLFAWEQIDGKTQLLKQDDLIVTPPVTLIPGNGEQLVRIIRQRPTQSDNEKSYRLIISEVPDTESPQGANLRVLLRMSLPVFVGGEGKEYALKAYYKDGTLRVKNTGTKHARFSDVFWTNQDSNQQYDIQKGLLGYALPGAELHLPADKTPPKGAIRFFSATINGESQTIMVEDLP